VLGLPVEQPRPSSGARIGRRHRCRGGGSTRLRLVSGGTVSAGDGTIKVRWATAPQQEQRPRWPNDRLGIVRRDRYRRRRPRHLCPPLDGNCGVLGWGQRPPTAVEGLTGVTAIAMASADMRPPVEREGEVLEPAQDRPGGTVSTEASDTPIMIGGLDVLPSGYPRTLGSCAALADGAVKCWGHSNSMRRRTCRDWGRHRHPDPWSQARLRRQLRQLR